ncbi:MAG: hypothetical protein ABI016_02995 [Chthoniobacterales bacterium]
MIEPLTLGAIEGCHETFSRLLHPPLGHLPNVSSRQARAYWLDEVKKDLSDPSAAAWIARRSDESSGLLLFLDAPWETKIVEEPVGTLRHFALTNRGEDNEALDELLQTALQHAVDRGIRCLVCKLDPREVATIHALERHGFLLMDSLLDFVFDYPAPAPNERKTAGAEGGLQIRPSTEEDIAEVTAIAERAFADYFGRYHADPRVSRAAATNFYRKWVESSFAGWADLILVAEVDRQIAGFGIWKKASELEARHGLGLAHYNLAGIHPDFSGRGLYSALAAEGMERIRPFASHLIGPVHVSNFPVHRALHRLGWKIRGARHSFHKWL